MQVRDVPLFNVPSFLRDIDVYPAPAFPNLFCLNLCLASDPHLTQSLATLISRHMPRLERGTDISLSPTVALCVATYVIV
jgi:hypothetical protein